MMKRKRAHDEKIILKFDRKDHQLPDIHGCSDDETKTLEVSTAMHLDRSSDAFLVQVDDMTITIQGSNDTMEIDGESSREKKKKKRNRRDVDKEFFIPYQPADFKRERG